MKNLTIWVAAYLLVLVIAGFVKADATIGPIETTTISTDTVAFTDPDLTYVNGIYRLDDKPYSGTVYRVLKGYAIETYSPVVDGRLHGRYTSYYANGDPYETRTYSNGLSTGTHIGYWEGAGHKKFEYNYLDQKKEGTQRTWYRNGDPAEAYFYHDDQLSGRQQAWRENGSLYRNYIVKEGIPYGLQKSKTCYEVSDQRVVRQADKPAAK